MSIPMNDEDIDTTSKRSLPEKITYGAPKRGKVILSSARECRIFGHSHQDPVSTPCGDVFCRQCILKDLEEQSATGGYTCPRCRWTFATRPALHPYQRNSDSFQSFFMSHKASLKRRIEQFGEGITKAGSHTSHRIYITKDMQTENLHSISCNDIFKPFKIPSRWVETHIRTVITQGVAGIGKTTSVHLFILDWADGKANEDVNFVFMLPFWKLNLVKDVSCSLQKLLLNFHPELHKLADFKAFDYSKSVVIFDGLDESQLPLDFQDNQMVCDITETSALHTLITNIIKGNLLPFSKVWITSDASSTKLPSWYINRVTEIRPFSDSHMEECVREGLNDVREASEIIQQIQMSRELYAMCQIPVFCSIAVRAVKNMLVQGESKMIQTSNELYSCFLLGQTKTEAEAKTVQVKVEVDEGKPHRTRREVMLRFAQLAFRQLMDNNFTFSEQDLKECDIDVSEAPSLCRICMDNNQEKSEFFQETLYCFAHVSIQGFLAALCVFDAHICKNMNILKDFFEDISSIQPEDVSLDILLKSATDKVLKRKNGHQDFFIHFLLGMYLESKEILLQSLLTDIPSTSETAKSTFKDIKDLRKQTAVPLGKCIDLLHYQIEMQDPCVLENIESLLTSQQDFVSSYWTEISILIKKSGRILDEFKLKEHHPSTHHRVLPMFVSHCRRAQLSYCHLSHDLCGVLVSALQKPHCPLRELDMSGNYLMDSGVKLLCSGLKSPNCKLEVLRLSCCDLSDVSCKHVASALQQPDCPLRELDMGRNGLVDSGIKQLYSGLKSPNCKVEVLRLSNCLLTHVSCGIVASALQQPRCPLRELDLGGNYLMKPGVELLCSGFKSPNCKLGVLRLSSCRLTHVSCGVLASALQQPHCPLRELDLSRNDLMDSGAELLCCGVKSPNCKLEVLRLSKCKLLKGSCGAVASVLQQPHCPLRELDMGRNDLMDSGVELLVSGLKSPNCKLQILRLSCCDLSDVSCEVVASALQQPHCPLRELDVSSNDLMDSGVKLLCSGLKIPNCKLEILRLSSCKLLKGSCEVVASALQQPHCPLRELDMGSNYLTDSGVEVLCSGFKGPNCKLQILRLSGCWLTDRSCLILNSVLDSYHSCLRELDVSNNCLEDSRVNLLKERLENAGKCKMETLTSQTGTVFPESSHAMKSDFPKIPLQSSLSRPQQSTPDHISPVRVEFKDEPLDIKNYECDDEKSRVTKEYFGGASAKNEIESISDRTVEPEVFTPESNSYSDRKSYRFSCSSEGLFQCRFTGLVFKMDTGGEVEYRTEPWNCKQLAHLKYVPAGPLFDIKCPQGTLSQIHFPHCEVFSGKGSKHLSVIHISDSDEDEMLDPHETTDSYVVLNIRGWSKYGLTKKQPKKKYPPIKGLVLLFLEQKTLNVLLLPKNVVISEVSEKRKKMKEPTEEKYIETTPNCELVPEKPYSLSSDPAEHEVTPLSAKFRDYENYENYVPTFQVFLTKLERVKLNLKRNDSDKCVWLGSLQFPASPTERRPSVPPSSPYILPGREFFSNNKAELEARLGLLSPILSQLESCGVLSTEEREAVKSKESSSERNHSLLLMIENKGGTAQEKFYNVLKKCDGCLVEDLEGH